MSNKRPQGLRCTSCRFQSAALLRCACPSYAERIIWNILTTARERIWTTVGTPINSTAHTRLFRVRNTKCAAKRCTHRQSRRVREALSLGRLDVPTVASGAPLHADGLDHFTEVKWVPHRGRRRWGGRWQLGFCSRGARAGAQVPQETQPPLPPRVPSLERRPLWLRPEAATQNPRGPGLCELEVSVPTGGPGPFLSVRPCDKREKEALGTRGARGRSWTPPLLLPRTHCVCA